MRSTEISFSPDNSLRWERVTSFSRGVLYLSPNAPVGAADVLGDPRRYRQERIVKSESSTIHMVRLNEKEYVLKTSNLRYPSPRTSLRHGVAAVALNAGFAKGLELLGEDADLPTEMRITAPEYYGACFHGLSSTVLLDYAPGVPARRPAVDTNRLCFPKQREEIYGLACEKVGYNPDQVDFQDDDRHLLVSPGLNIATKLDLKPATGVNFDFRVA